MRRFGERFGRDAGAPERPKGIVDKACAEVGNSPSPMHPTANLPSVRRNTNLDALRAIAILMVLGRHAGQGMTLQHASTFYSVGTERIGWAGVDLFFVLSGFLISGLLFSDYQTHGRLSAGRFYIRRGLKIWPAMYALIASGLLIDALTPGHHFTTRNLWPELFFMQDYFRGIWGITWSIAVEEHFYLCLPLLLLWLLRRNPGKPFAALPWIFAGIAVFCLACRFAVGWGEDGYIIPLKALFPTHLRMDGLMFGVLICYFKRFRPGVYRWMVRWQGGWWVIAAAVVLLSIFPLESRQMHTWGFTAVYLGAGFLVAKAVAQEGPRPIRVISSLLARIGFYSYSIYIWHMFFVWMILPHLRIASPVGTYWASICGPILFGIVLAKVLEIPVLRFRDRVFPSLSGPIARAEQPQSDRDAVAAG